MPKIVLILAYDGSSFNGWQRQTLTTNTIQYTLETALSELCMENILLNASGRTDAKVSADYQVATFITNNISIPSNRYPLALNRLLPPTIRINKSFEIDPNFDARRHATKRTYQYNLVSGHYVMPKYRFIASPAHIKLDLNRLNYLAKLFIGYHDFSAFCSSKDENSNKCRYLYSCYFYINNSFITMKIEANAFLMNMVRCIVGTIIYYHDRDDGEIKIIEALQSANKKLAGPTAAGDGLSLSYVEYSKEWQLFFQ